MQIEGLVVCAWWKYLWSSCRTVKQKLEPRISHGQDFCLQKQVWDALWEGWNRLAADCWELGAGLTKPAGLRACLAENAAPSWRKERGIFLHLHSLNLASLKGCCRFPQLEGGESYESSKFRFSSLFFITARSIRLLVSLSCLSYP